MARPLLRSPRPCLLIPCQGWLSFRCEGQRSLFRASSIISSSFGTLLRIADPYLLLQPSSIQYEGVYFNFMFPTGSEKDRFFAPSFSSAVSKDPLTGDVEHWLAVGLNSKLDGPGLALHGGRPGINLAIVVDVSGSMQSDFGDGDKSSKLDVAKLALINGLLPQLRPTDRLSILTFTDTYKVIKPLTLVSAIDMGALKTQIMELQPNGGTTLTAGIEGATAQLKPFFDAPAGNHNRVFYMTDMCPNHLDSDGKSLFEAVDSNATHGCYTTFIGIGVDFNTDVVQRIAQVKACNYFYAASAKAFKKLMDEEFAYIVTIAALDLKISLSEGADDYTVEHVFGSPGHEGGQRGVLCEMNSVFPSRKENAELTKGGVVVVKLKRKEGAGPGAPLKLTTKYFDPEGAAVKLQNNVTFPETESWQDNAVRKAVLLTRYVYFVKQLLGDASTPPVPSTYVARNLFTLPSPLTADSVRAAYRPLYGKFKAYFAEEAEALADPALMKEFENLQLLMKEDHKLETPAAPAE